MDISAEGMQGIYSPPQDQRASMEALPLPTPQERIWWGLGWGMRDGGCWAGEGGEGIALGRWCFLDGRQETWGEDRALAGEEDPIGVLALLDTAPPPPPVTLGTWPPPLGL